jgi:DNA-binding PadR family transcriptional regulator
VCLHTGLTVAVATAVLACGSSPSAPSPGPGALYGAINRLVEQDLIEESDERPDPHLDDERRRYYRITPFGRRVARAEAGRLRKLVRLAEDALGLPDFA